MRPLLPTIWVSPSSCLLHHWQLIKEEVIENPLQETVQNPSRVFCLGGGEYNQWPYTKDQDKVEKSVGSKRGGYKDIYGGPHPPVPPPHNPLCPTNSMALHQRSGHGGEKCWKQEGRVQGYILPPPHPPPPPPKSWQDNELSSLAY